MTSINNKKKAKTWIMPFVIAFMFIDWRYSQIQIFAGLDMRLVLNDNGLRGLKDNFYISRLNNWVKETPQDEMGNIFKGVQRSSSVKAQDTRYRTVPSSSTISTMPSLLNSSL